MVFKMKKLSYYLLILCMGLALTSCEKEEEEQKQSECCSTDSTCCSDNGDTARMAMKSDGYTEIETIPLEKIDCYFEEWDKTLITTVSGTFEYYDENENWVATIDFGDGTCNQWATKTWDTNTFPDYPTGSEEFSLFE
jgi:hypothetical protein